MKQLYFFCAIMVLTLQAVYGWGESGHKLIVKHAMILLPAEMKDFRQLSDYLIAEAGQPDQRRKYMKDEYPKHFIDIDFFKEFNRARMIENKDSLCKIYGDSVITENGTLPWTLQETYHQLVFAMKNKQKEKTKELMRDLSHYLADAHQPMHTILNYNGQLSGQTDIHERYESEMLNAHLPELDKAFPTSTKIKKIVDPNREFFQIIYRSNARSAILFSADKAATVETSGKYDSLYYAILWFKTKDVTEEALEEASAKIASIYYTAWLEAGKPKFNRFK
ncbi:MAG: S1/P1 nuclease [Ignavibacteria bacterium]|nr:S1/P1 nuclease [Ignavibacteria bacterium]